jgi:hypothetical protein
MFPIFDLKSNSADFFPVVDTRKIIPFHIPQKTRLPEALLPEGVLRLRGGKPDRKRDPIGRCGSSK